MKATRTKLGILIALASAVYFVCPCRGNASPAQPSEWNIQIDTVDPGQVNIEPAFRAAIYENLVEELIKIKRFNQVFRSGDRRASEAAELLILKTTVQKYVPGSETRRAVTTFGGATKLRVNNQLCRKDGQVLFQWVVDGNVRFMGGNLRATHTLARHVADKVKEATLPSVSSQKTGQPSSRDNAVQKAHLWNNGELSENLDGYAKLAVESKL